jgi:raffinose/stachyose/melibiose transport system permease protein
MTTVAQDVARKTPGKPFINEYTATAILFLFPAFFFLAVFVVWPILSSLQLSFVEWNGISPQRDFVGFDNWARLFKDSVFWRAFKNNLIIVALSILVQLPIAMALAVLLDKGGKKLQLFKTVYFFPMLMSTVAIGILFKYIYDPQFGLVTSLLETAGLKFLVRNWLGDPNIVLYSVIAVICWQFIPFYMILFLAALTGIPEELREAAFIDGATENQYFWRIVLPLLRGTISTAVVLSLIGSLKYFDLIWVMTEGGPANASELMATYMYKKAFQSFEMGYGSTVATALFIIVMVIALTVFFRLNRERWAGE